MADESCDVCLYEREDCDCWEFGDEDSCHRCGGSGSYVPMHCCACGGGEYDCTCCPHCSAPNAGKCPCILTVQAHDGGTIAVGPA